MEGGVEPPHSKVTIILPCYNEEASLPYLAKTLEQVEFALAPRYAPQFLFVDDGSKDTTWDVLHSVFAAKSNCRFIQQPQNGGVSKAILTGIEAAETDIVCSMDCDCSYDPLELKNMLPLLTDGVDLVTASPYHPAGRVKNVPSWRLGLSKGLSILYRSFLPQKLHTWTSCFRVYRRSAIVGLPLVETGFLGTAELAAQLSLNGSRIVEHPATLSVRIFGESKMKTCRTIRGHLRLLARLFLSRWRRTRPTSANQPLSPSQPAIDPEGIAAISRGSERSANPRLNVEESRIPEGCQQSPNATVLSGIPPGCHAIPTDVNRGCSLRSTPG